MMGRFWTVTGLGTCLLMGVALLPIAQAQTAFPERALRMVVTFAPGGGTDMVARAVARQLAVELGQPVVVDNRPGGGGAVGATHVARAKPDGYTLMFATTSTLAVAPALQRVPPYDATRDFEPVAQIARGPFVLSVRNDVPAASVQGLIDLARKNPGRLNAASPGQGSSHHLAAELLQQRAQISVVHVPYQGGAPAWTALAAGEVDLMFDTMPQPLQYQRTGRTRILAVAGPQRLAAIADVPTLSEAGVKDADVMFFWGYVVPRATPPEIVQRLSAAIHRAVNNPEVQKTFEQLSVEPALASASEYGEIIRREVLRWTDVIHESRLKQD